MSAPATPRAAATKFSIRHLCTDGVVLENDKDRNGEWAGKRMNREQCASILKEPYEDIKFRLAPPRPKEVTGETRNSG